jgi:hypothetical protein
MSIQLPQDIDRLRADCSKQFAAIPVIEFAVAEILRCLDREVWADEQGVPAEICDLLNIEISPALEDVFEAQSPTDCLAAANRLVSIWREIQRRIEPA